METKILDGKKIAAEIRDELKKEVLELKKRKIVPRLVVVLVGDNPASEIYVSGKEKACAEVGIESAVIRFSQGTSQKKLEKIIAELNSDSKTHGILIQLPLPEHISEKEILEMVDPRKDVDCFHPENVGRLLADAPRFLPCTPAGVLEILKRNKIGLAGKDVVIVGRSNIVGKPLAAMFINESATVTVCHSKTKKIREKTKQADILVAAVGRAGFIRSDMVKRNAVVVDVGINRKGNGKISGDVDFEKVSKIASAITPVPGGVGPMTIAMLLKNTVKAAKNKKI